MEVTVRLAAERESIACMRKSYLCRLVDVRSVGGDERLAECEKDAISRTQTLSFPTGRCGYAFTIK